MKNGFYVCWLLLIPFWASCQRSLVFTKKLQQVDSLCEADPREAMNALRVIEREAKDESEYAHRKWDLLWTKAQFKSDIPLETDSAMKRSVEYFDEHGTPMERAEAHYYLAAVYFDKHDSPRCITHALKAMELLEGQGETGAHVETLFRVCSMLSYVYRRQLNYPEALAFARKAYGIAERNELLDPFVIMDVATSYYRVGKLDSMDLYYKITLENIRREHSEAENATHICEMLGIYSDIGKKEEATSCYEILQNLPRDARPENYNCTCASYFELVGLPDSAIYYHNRDFLNSNDSYGRRSAALGMMSIYADKGLYAEAIKYARAYVVANDSVWEMLKMEQSNNAKNEFQYQRDMAREAEAYRQAREAKEKFWLAVGAGVLVLLSLLLVYVEHSRRATRRILEQREEIERVKGSNRSLVQTYLRANADADESSTMKKFLRAAKGYERVENENEWKDLYVVLDRLYPGFYQQVVTRLPDKDLRNPHIACLLKMGMSVPEIINVTGISKATAYRRVEHVRAMMTDFSR